MPSAVEAFFIDPSVSILLDDDIIQHHIIEDSVSTQYILNNGKYYVRKKLSAGCRLGTVAVGYALNRNVYTVNNMPEILRNKPYQQQHAI